MDPSYIPDEATIDSSSGEYAEQAYRRYVPQLRRFLRSQLQSNNDAEDLAQETWLRMHGVTFQSVEHARAFIFHVARHLAIDEMRKRKVRTASESINMQQLAMNSPGCEELLLSLERFELFWQMSRALPVRRRRVFFMHKLRDLSHQEIACRLGITTHTVERHIVRALSHYRSMSSRSVNAAQNRAPIGSRSSLKS